MVTAPSSMPCVAHSQQLLCVYLCRLEGQILARFEEENGGRLLIATLCLLEVSARGLLEVELLSILADEENLIPLTLSDVADDSEKDDEESVGKSEQFTSTCSLIHISFTVS